MPPALLHSMAKRFRKTGGAPAHGYEAWTANAAARRACCYSFRLIRHSHSPHPLPLKQKWHSCRFFSGASNTRKEAARAPALGSWPCEEVAYTKCSPRDGQEKVGGKIYQRKPPQMLGKKQGFLASSKLSHQPMINP